MLALREGARVGRCDIVQHAIGKLRDIGPLMTPDMLVGLISSLAKEGDAATPLHSASAAGHTDVIRALLNAGAQVNVVPMMGPHEGKRAFEACKTEASKSVYHIFFFEQIARGNMFGCLALLEGGVPATLAMKDTEDSALHWACNFGSYDIARVLLDHGAECNSANTMGQTALHLACKSGDSVLVSLLLSHGADETALDSDGKLPLDLLEHEHCDAIPVLIRNRPSFAKAIPQPKSGLNKAEKKEKTEDELEYFASEEDEQGGAGMGAADAPMFVLWPPVQVQRRIVGRNLVLNGESPTFICIPSVDIDMFPLLTWSGLVDILDKAGMSVQVKRSAVDCAFRFSVNPRLCPGRHRYEINITSQSVFVQASDSTGLLYAAQTLTQIISLHAESHVSGGVPQITLPCVEIIDFPDMPDRGVLWSYRSFLRTASQGMRSAAQQLSRLRLNQLYLIVDSASESTANANATATATANGSADPAAARYQPSSSTAPDSANAAAKLCAIDEVARRHNIEVVPTLFVYRKQPVEDYFPTDLLRNLSGKHVCIVLALEKMDLPSARELCQDALRATMVAGMNSAVLVPNAWTHKNVDVLSIAHDIGLDAVVRPWKIFVPPTLLTRPLCCVQNLVVDLKMCAANAARRGESCSVVPAMMDVYFSQPMLMVKYVSFLHAGFSWNSRGVTDMLGRRADVSILRECISLMLLDGQGARNEASKTRFSALLELFTGPVPSSSEQGPAAEGVLHPPLDIAGDEEALVALVCCSSGGGRPTDGDVRDTIAPPRASLAALLRHYKRILVATQWKCAPLSNHTASGDKDNAAAQEMHEYLMAVHLMSVVCRALVLGYNSASLTSGQMPSAPTREFTVGELLGALQSGTKTDVANALLEAVDVAVDCWRGRFDLFSKSLFFGDGGDSEKDNKSDEDDTGRKGAGTAGTAVGAKINKVSVEDGRVLARAAQLKQSYPEVPGLSLLRIIGESIPDVFLEQIIDKLSS